MWEFGSKRPDIVVTDDFKVYEIIGEEAKKHLDLLKNEVESVSRKIQIILRLPRIFRDAITMEEKFQWQYVFTISETDAVKFGLVNAE